MNLGKRKFSNIHREYKEFKEKDKDLLSLYNQVKREYIENKELDITLEKVYLERKLSEYRGETLNMYINILYTIMTTIMTVIITLNIERNSDDLVNIIFTIIGIGFALFTILFVGIYTNKKVIRVEIDEHIYYSICLEVINEIEKNKNILDKNTRR